MQSAATPVKRALLSVSDKTGLEAFAKSLIDNGVEIISTGGTSKLLGEWGIPHLPVESLTQLPEMLDGRVKTLHPKIHGGILGKRDKHAKEVAELGIAWIDLVVVNFYPFSEKVQPTELDWSKVVEYIDIGGPTMVRAAAKNFAWVGVVVDPSDYAKVTAEIAAQQGLSFATRQRLAGKVFAMTAEYDAMISAYFAGRETHQEPCPDKIHLTLQKQGELRYGENPHQRASAYKLSHTSNTILSAKQHQGKPLSYNNILDAEAALNCVHEFQQPAAVIVKHANPCGAAVATDINAAYVKAYQADSLSAFGGIVALNRTCTQEIATAITQIFMEVVIAPDYSEAALKIFATKPNLRVLAMPIEARGDWEMRYIQGGVLVQERDTQMMTVQDLQVVTRRQPDENDLQTMLFAWRVLKHIKSNGILIAKNDATVGIGAGQVSRVDAVELAVRKASVGIQDAVLASDAFFPFRDSIDKLANTGIRAIIQPGGSLRDEEVIAACDEHNIAMVLTGKRCFKH